MALFDFLYLEIINIFYFNEIMNLAYLKDFKHVFLFLLFILNRYRLEIYCKGKVT